MLSAFSVKGVVCNCILQDALKHTVLPPYAFELRSRSTGSGTPPRPMPLSEAWLPRLLSLPSHMIVS